MVTEIKSKLNELYKYLGGKRGIVARAIAYPSVALLTHYFGETYLQGVIVDFCAESFYRMSRPPKNKETVTLDRLL